MLAIQCIDADQSLEMKLIKNLDYPLNVADNVMAKLETQNMDGLAKLENVVVVMSEDLFLSNNSHKKFQKSLKILIKVEKNNQIEVNLQNLLEKYCDVTMQEKNIDIEGLIKILKK